MMGVKLSRCEASSNSAQDQSVSISMDNLELSSSTGEHALSPLSRRSLTALDVIGVNRPNISRTSSQTSISSSDSSTLVDLPLGSSDSDLAPRRNAVHEERDLAEGVPSEPTDFSRSLASKIGERLMLSTPPMIFIGGIALAATRKNAALGFGVIVATCLLTGGVGKYISKKQEDE